MIEELPTLPHQYQAPELPKGPHMAHPKQSGMLMKAMKSLHKFPGMRARKGLISRDAVKIKHKKVKYW